MRWIGPPSDIDGLVVILYEFCPPGRMPFQGDLLAHARKSLRNCCAGTVAGLQTVVDLIVNDHGQWHRLRRCRCPSGRGEHRSCRRRLRRLCCRAGNGAAHGHEDDALRQLADDQWSIEPMP